MASTQYRFLGSSRALHRALNGGGHRHRARARTLVGASAALLCAVALACGSGDSGDAGGGGYGEESASETPPVSAQGPAEGGSGSGAEGTPPEVQGCLDLVGDAKFREAVPVCLRAVEAAPGNEEVQQALDRAQREVAQSEAGEAAGSAKEAVEGEAGEASEGASKALEGLGD